MMTHNFEYWKDLYESDPFGFEIRREECLGEYIAEQWADDPIFQQRARAVVWRLNQDLRHIKNPTERFNQLVVHFWQQVKKFQSALNDLTELTNE